MLTDRGRFEERAGAGSFVGVMERGAVEREACLARMGAGMGVGQILHHMTWRVEGDLFVGIASVGIVWVWMKFAMDGGMEV